MKDTNAYVTLKNEKFKDANTLLFFAKSIYSPFYAAPLEQRQNKNDSIQPKIIPILKLTRFFPIA